MDSLQLSGSLEDQVESLDPERMLTDAFGEASPILLSKPTPAPYGGSAAAFGGSPALTASPAFTRPPSPVEPARVHEPPPPPTQHYDAPAAAAAGAVAFEPPPVQASVVPALFLSPAMADHDDCACLLAFLDNSGCEYNKITVTRGSLTPFLPPSAHYPSSNGRSSCFLLRRRPFPSTENIGHAMYGTALLWECAKAANLMPLEAHDVMIATDFWARAMNLLHQARCKKGTERHNHKNRELRWFILDLKRIEANLGQICSPGQSVPSVLGAGKVSFADYAVARLFTVLLDDASGMRLPYTRQKKYPRIIEIAASVRARRMNKQRSGVRTSTVDQVLGVKTWEQTIEERAGTAIPRPPADRPAQPPADRPAQPPAGGPVPAGGGSRPNAHDPLPPQDDSDEETNSSSSTLEYIYAQQMNEMIVDGSQRLRFPENCREEHIRYINGVRLANNFIFVCPEASPLRTFLSNYGTVVARRQPTWLPLKDLWSGNFPHQRFLPFDQDEQKFLAIYTSRRTGTQPRLCWDLADMFAHKKLFSRNSLVDVAAVELLDHLVEPHPVPLEALVKLEASLKMKPQFNPVLPTIARLLVEKYVATLWNPAQFPLLARCQILDPKHAKLMTKI